MNNTLIMQIHQSLQHLRDIHRHEVFGELAESFADIVEGAVFAVFEDDVEIFTCFDKALVFDDVGVL